MNREQSEPVNTEIEHIPRWLEDERLLLTVWLILALAGLAPVFQPLFF